MQITGFDLVIFVFSVLKTLVTKVEEEKFTKTWHLKMFFSTVLQHLCPVIKIRFTKRKSIDISGLLVSRFDVRLTLK